MNTMNVSNAVKGSYHDLLIMFVTAVSAWGCLFIDTGSSLLVQNLMGLCAWSVLFLFLLFESRLVQAQILIAVAFATVGEYFASPYMGGYTYRLGNVPAFVPPGHGMVYLTAVALGRSMLFTQYRSFFMNFAIISGSIWAAWGVMFAEQKDTLGALMFLLYLVILAKGRSTMVYLGAYYITSYLEWVGTIVGTWQWAPIDPVLGLAQGNPPSGVATWYCLVDAVALGFSPLVLRAFSTINHWRPVQSVIRVEQALQEVVWYFLVILVAQLEQRVPLQIIPTSVDRPPRA